ncbi:tetratricopeptide repeat protein [candidate division KSB1 bacterium]|nr:tetratricopeptide repeat protein [candidate division KSB1 bacterium]
MRFRHGQHAEAEYLSDGIPESIISSLQKLEGIKVISFNSVLKRYKGQIPEANEVGNEFNVKAVALGRLTLAGDDITVSIEIVDTRDNSVLFSNRYIKKITDLIALQNEIAGDVSENLSARLTGEGQRETVKLTVTDPEAFRYMLLANQFVSKRSVDDFYRALEYLDTAIEIDPGYAMAFALKSYTHSLLPVYEMMYMEDHAENAKSAADKALDLDPGLSEAYTASGLINFNEWNWEEAITDYEKAIDLNANNANAYNALAWAKKSFRDFEEAKLLFEKTLELDPLNVAANRGLGESLSNLGDHDNALLFSKKAIELDPLGIFSWHYLFRFYVAAGQFKEASETQREVFTLAGIPEAESVFNDVFRDENYSMESLIRYQDEIFDNTEALTTPFYNNPAIMWITMLNRDDIEGGFEYLDSAVEMKDDFIKYVVARNDKFSELMEYPRYREALRKMGMDKYIK